MRSIERGDESASGPTGPRVRNARVREFDTVVVPHLEGAYQFAHCLTGDPERCRRAMKQALRRAFREFERFHGGSGRSWLFAIVRHCCQALEAGAGGSVALLIREGGLAGASGLLQAPSRRRKWDQGHAPAGVGSPGHVRLVIEAIPDPFREAVVLHELQQLTPAEIAEVTGLPVRTVIARLAVGRWIVEEELQALPLHSPDARICR